MALLVPHEGGLAQGSWHGGDQSLLLGWMLCKGGASIGSGGGREWENGHFKGIVICVKRRHVTFRKAFPLFLRVQGIYQFTSHPPRVTQDF